MNAILINGDININTVFEAVKSCNELTEWAKNLNLAIKYWRTDLNTWRETLTEAVTNRNGWFCDPIVDEAEFSSINKDNMNTVDCYTYIYDTDDCENDPDLTEDEKDHCDMDFCVFVLGNKIIGFQTHQD